MKATLLLIATVLSAVPALAQDESAVHAAFAKEAEEVKTNCGSGGIKGVGSCASVLATGQPLHLAFGSLAPLNGFGFGLALVGHHTPNESWRVNWNSDALVTPGGNWRAGFYGRFVRAPGLPSGASTVAPAVSNASGTGEYPAYSVHAEAISLDRLLFSGLGPGTSTRSSWGMSQTIIGGNALVPIRSGGLGLAVTGGASVRLIQARSGQTRKAPSIETLYTRALAPGLGDDTHVLQLTGGVRLTPSWFGTRVRPDYLLTADQFVAPAAARASFTRWTMDLRHVFPLYKTSRSPAVPDANGSGGCQAATPSDACASVSHDRNGMFTVRALGIVSTARTGHTVPFYLQPTLGGSDINGGRLLASFPDYQFRAPNAVVFQAIFEHSIWEPLGFVAMAEQGRVALDRGELFSHLRHSYATGLTVRAGGFPQLTLLFAWGHEGHHVAATMNPSLLGGSTRPSLY